MKRAIKLLSLVFFIAMIFSACGTESGDNLSATDVSADILHSSAESNAESVEESQAVLESAEESSESSVEAPLDSFYILYTEDEVDFSKAPKAEISNYPWNSDYTPYCYGQVVFKKDDGFYVHMYCEESNPKTEIKENGGNVYLDSALEFFCDYNPKKDKTTPNYINLEMNSAGVYLAQYNHSPVLDLTDEEIEVSGNRRKNYWSVTAHIPIGVIKDVYGEFELGEGSIVECNFTKCGSGTKIKHWGTWQTLGGSSPNFHQPEFFARVEIRK